jgi:enoyl-CoA hydratase/carnithine racemase
MPDYEHLRVAREGPVAVCTIVNPPQNFMNGRMVQEFLQLADEVGPTVRQGIVDPASHLPVGRSTQTLCMES